MAYKYAELPNYTYQPVTRQYQTFNFETSSYSFYPITYSQTDLTEGQNQDNNEPAADPEKAPDSEEAPVAEPSASPDDAPAAESTSKCLSLETTRPIAGVLQNIGGQRLTCFSRSRGCTRRRCS